MLRCWIVTSDHLQDYVADEQPGTCVGMQRYEKGSLGRLPQSTSKCP